MLFTINKKTLPLLAIIILLSSCHSSHNSEDGHNHNNETENTTAEKDENSNLVSLSKEQINTVGITLGHIENKELTAALRANGVLRVPNYAQASVTSLYGGVVKTLPIEIGNYIKKGQVIATIANPQFIQLQEEYLTIKSRIAFAQQELQRQKELNEGNAGALKNLQTATSELNSLQTRRASIRQQLQLSGINPDNITNENLRSTLTITSPISGAIGTIYSKIGSYVDISSPIVDIIDNGAVHLDLEVFEKDLAAIKVDQVIHFTLTNNPAIEYDAKVYNIGSTLEAESKTISVHCDVIGKKTGLLNGMNVTALISLDNASRPAVPDEAIIDSEGRYYIFVLNETVDHTEGNQHSTQEKNATTYERIEVVKGVSGMGYTAITPVKDISPNRKIVTKGAFFINAKMNNTGGHNH